MFIYFALLFLPLRSVCLVFFLSFLSFSLYLFAPIHGNRASVLFALAVTGFAFSSEIFLIAQRPESSTVVEFQRFQVGISPGLFILYSLHLFFKASLSQNRFLPYFLCACIIHGFLDASYIIFSPISSRYS